MTEGERKVMENLANKSDKASDMFKNLVREMNYAQSIDKHRVFKNKEEFPSWL